MLKNKRPSGIEAANETDAILDAVFLVGTNFDSGFNFFSHINFRSSWTSWHEAFEKSGQGI